jgi:hypothetical protein
VKNKAEGGKKLDHFTQFIGVFGRIFLPAEKGEEHIVTHDPVS